MKCPKCGSIIDKYKPDTYITKSRTLCHRCGFVKYNKQKVKPAESNKPESDNSEDFV